MRILRGQSNLEVSSKGFALFVFGLILATFAGGAVRTVLSSDQVHNRIVNELKARFPQHEFQIGQTEILLSRGLWPGLGLRVRAITVHQEVCGKLSFTLNIPEAVLPLDLLSLRKGIFRLNDVEISGGELHLDYHDCPRAAAGATPPAAAATEPLPKSIVAPKLEWQKLAQFLDGVRIKNFAVTYEKSPTWKLLFNSAYMRLGKTLTLKAQVEAAKSLPFGALVHPLLLEVHGDGENLDWLFAAEFKEGQIEIHGRTDAQMADSDVNLAIRQVPVKDFMSEIYQMGFVERELKLKATWLTCYLEWKGSLRDYAANPLRARDCRLEGGYGHAEMSRAEFWLDKDWLRKPARITITQMQMQPVIEALHREVLPAVISHLGVWNGQLDLENSRAWTLDGHLQGLEVVFSNQSTRGKQLIEDLHSRLHREGARIQGQVDAVKLREGEFDGLVNFDLTDDWRGGVFSAKIEKINLSPSIQKLLTGGGFASLKGEGHGELMAGELSEWQGGFSIPEIHGEGWSAEAIQVHSKFQKNVFQLVGSASHAHADSSWFYFPDVRVINPEAADQIEWRDFATVLEIGATNGRILRLTAQDGSRGKWSAHGEWERDGAFNGALAFAHGKKPQNFVLHGEKGALSVNSN